MKGEAFGLGDGLPMGCMVAATRTCRVAGSTNRRCFAKKSHPMIRLSTPANTKQKLKCIAQNFNETNFVPQAGMGLPSAQTKDGPVGGKLLWWGRMLLAAPVSARKFIPLISSRK